MFHGGPKEIDTDQINRTRGRYDLCLCDDFEVSKGYSLEDSETGYVHEVELDCFGGIEPETVCEILDDCGIDREGIGPESPYFYLLVDRVDVQECLVENGEPVVEYTDEDWSNVEHQCVRVFEPGHVTVKNVERVER